MVDSCYYFLLDGGSGVDMSAVNIELTSISGETITETLALKFNESKQSIDNDIDVYYCNADVDDNYPFNYQAGKVTAADESGSGVSILQSSEAGVEKTPSTQQQDESDSTSQTADSDVKQVSTKSAAGSSTSPVFVALIVLAAVGSIALAAVAYTVKKKKLDDKRIDRDEGLARSFDTFSSPVRIDETIAKI
ncbi:Carbohydrate-binding protein [Phytophthora palmivora]|uniref:Carbohydrate-binding protein n=1 Tax=Phytophthora palmivora TaxID=4796 RepID=A0A2P4XCZ0_9STRA|nr:Carbohydrate-binding protein [Phytophthora palmivora]